MTLVDARSEHLQLGRSGERAERLGWGLAAVGVLLSIVLYFFSTPPHFFRAYLMAFCLAFSISMGALIFVMIHHVTRAGWSVVLRRISEALAMNLQWLAIAFIPVAIAMFAGNHTLLFPWTVDSVVADSAVLQGKQVWFDGGLFTGAFWLLRAAAFFAIWIFLARFYWTRSVKQDQTGDVHLTHEMQRLAPAGILLFALTLTFASVDWIMSLAPEWFSTIFGVYVFAASCCGYFASLAIITVLLHRAGKVKTEITLEHQQDIGKFLFGFGIVFWAYIAFSQYMLIWYANVPEETTWYLARQVGGWWVLGLVLLFGHFGAPFLLLVSKHPKRIPLMLASIGGFMLLMSLADFYYLVMPEIPGHLIHEANSYEQLTAAYATASPPAAELEARGLEDGLTYGDVYGIGPRLEDATLVLAFAGAFIAMTARTLCRAALVPVNDPRLGESLAFENM